MSSIDPNVYRSVMTQDDIQAMNDRTEIRLQEAIRRLGTKWLGYARNKEGVPIHWPAMSAKNVTTIRRRL